MMQFFVWLGEAKMWVRRREMEGGMKHTWLQQQPSYLVVKD